MLKIILICIVLLNGCSTYEEDALKIKKISGMELPKSATLIKNIDEWTEFNGAGFSLRIYKLNPKYTWLDIKNCEQENFVVTKYKDSYIKPSLISNYIDKDDLFCIKESQSNKVNEVLVIQSNFVYYFWFI